MKPSLQLKMGQQLTMTPQLQQAIRLLQLSTLDLKAEIQQAIESNPMLEVQDENESFLPENNWQTNYPSSIGHYSNDDHNDYINQLHDKHESLHEHLLWQLRLTPFSDKDQLIATMIIDALNEDGYLTQSLEEIQQALPQEAEIELDEIETMLHWLQQCDPHGVGARNLQECLVLQLNKLPDDTHALALTQEIIHNHFELLSSRQFAALMKLYKLKDTELHDIVLLIQSLNPRPGSAIGSSAAEYIYPDVIVFKSRGDWQVELNPDSIPNVNIHQGYASLIKRADNSTDNVYLKGQLQEARWLLKSLESRNDTLLKVARCIIEQQKGFLEYGEEAMKPMVLHDVAEAIEMHESTISRVTTQKYMHTPRGIFELKYFFSSHVSTQTGGECSSTAIRALIKKLIAEEDTNKPLSDNKIAQMLQQQGIDVARRTIAKYREVLRIPSSSERKRI